MSNQTLWTNRAGVQCTAMLWEERAPAWQAYRKLLLVQTILQWPLSQLNIQQHQTRCSTGVYSTLAGNPLFNPGFFCCYSLDRMKWNFLLCKFKALLNFLFQSAFHNFLLSFKFLLGSKHYQPSSTVWEHLHSVSFLFQLHFLGK